MFIVHSLLFSFFSLSKKINKVKWDSVYFSLSSHFYTVNLYASKRFAARTFFHSFFLSSVDLFPCGQIFLSRVVQLLKSTNEIWCSLLLFSLPLCVSRATLAPFVPPSSFRLLSVSSPCKRRIININTRNFPNIVKRFYSIFVTNQCVSSLPSHILACGISPAMVLLSLPMSSSSSPHRRWVPSIRQMCIRTIAYYDIHDIIYRFRANVCLPHSFRFVSFRSAKRLHILRFNAHIDGF